MELVLHIGAGKTGTSSIQQYLRQSARQHCEDNVLVVDSTLVREPTTQYPLANLNRFICDHIDNNWDPGLLSTEIHKMFRSARDRGAKKIIWSNEYLSIAIRNNFKLTKFLVKELKQLFEVKAIYYVRRQDLWLESAWKQWGIKVGRVPLKDYVAQMADGIQPDFYGVARDWVKLLDPGNLHVQALYPPVLASNDLLQDFCIQAGIDYKPVATVPEVNRILGPETLEFMHRANLTLFTAPEDNTVFNALERYSLGLPKGKDNTRMLSDAERNYVLRKFAENNRAIVEEFMPSNACELSSYFMLDGIAGPLKKPSGAIVSEEPALNQGYALAADLYNAVEKDIERYEAQIKEAGQYQKVIRDFESLIGAVNRVKIFPFARTGRRIRKLSKITRVIRKLDPTTVSYGNI